MPARVVPGRLRARAAARHGCLPCGHHELVRDRGRPLDRSTQVWVRATGTRILLSEHPWLDGPIGDPELIGDEWLERETSRLGGTVRKGGGLLGDFGVLAAEGFDPSKLAPEIVDFYERTDQWRLDVWSQWCPAAWPFGWVLSGLFARRLQQLALPLRPLDVSLGMDSQVMSVIDGSGSQLGAMWLRRLRSNGDTVYSGWYGTAQLPIGEHRSVSVSFPLPNGRLTVFLRPGVDDDGALTLTSPLSSFGGDGAYLIVADRDPQGAWVRRVPLAERFRVFVDEEGVLRTDHAVNLWTIPVIRLHYRLQHLAISAR